MYLFCAHASHPPLQRHMSDYGPRRDTWDSYGGGGGRRRGGGGWGGGGGDWGRRRSDDLGPPRSGPREDWNKPLPRNERVERFVAVCVLFICFRVYMYIYMCVYVCQLLLVHACIVLSHSQIVCKNCLPLLYMYMCSGLRTPVVNRVIGGHCWSVALCLKCASIMHTLMSTCTVNYLVLP